MVENSFLSDPFGTRPGTDFTPPQPIEYVWLSACEKAGSHKFAFWGGVDRHLKVTIRIFKVHTRLETWNGDWPAIGVKFYHLLQRVTASRVTFDNAMLNFWNSKCFIVAQRVFYISYNSAKNNTNFWLHVYFSNAILSHPSIYWLIQ